MANSKENKPTLAELRQAGEEARIKRSPIIKRDIPQGTVNHLIDSAEAAPCIGPCWFIVFPKDKTPFKPSEGCLIKMATHHIFGVLKEAGVLLQLAPEALTCIGPFYLTGIELEGLRAAFPEKKNEQTSNQSGNRGSVSHIGRCRRG